MASVQQIEQKINPEYSKEISLTGLASGGALVAAIMKEAMEVAKMMSVSGPMVGAPFRGNPGACLGIAMQAWQWEMNPFTVSQKAYLVKETIAYEAQLVAAVLNTRAPLQGRFKYEYMGEGEDRQCVVTARLEGSDDEQQVISPKLRDIDPKNSPLWKTDPDQQLGYYTIRNWGRRHCPEVMLGVYDIDEVQGFRGPDNAKDITPGGPPPAPVAADFENAPSDNVKAPTAEDTLEALQFAKTVEDLTAIWNPLYADGTISEWRKSHALGREIVLTYNTRKSEFELAANTPVEEIPAPEQNWATAQDYVDWAREHVETLDHPQAIDDWWEAEQENRTKFDIVDDSNPWMMALEAICKKQCNSVTTDMEPV